VSVVEKGYDWVDDRLTTSSFLKRNARKIFPDHWSFMLGEVALYSFIVLLLTGVYLTFFFKASQNEVIYNGSYTPLKGVSMTEAYASSLNISFDVRGGLLIRQIHHWAALFFVASISVHLMRVFFTGAFRKPREINWLIGNVLLTLAIVEGFAGYSLPDDLLSGTGLRITSGIILAVPVVGTWVSYLIFGGEFPGVDFIPRLYSIHILLIPGLILALITAHLMMVWYQKHTQFPGPGRTNDNVVGYPLMPVYMAKAGGFFFVVFGLTALMGAFVQINPIWAFGPYTPDQVTAGSQPDWYMGFLDGALRLMPNVELSIFGHPLSLNIIIPAMVVAGIIFTLMAIYPFIERWITGDTRVHNLLERPRDNATRTAIGVMSLTFYTMLWIAGGNDIIALNFHLSINSITWFLRIAIWIIPGIAFVVTKRFCLSLQRRDRDKLLHGVETGRILRLPNGRFEEVHQPIAPAEAAKILAREEIAPLPTPAKTDANGVRAKGYRHKALQAKLSQAWASDAVPVPTQAEIEEGQMHAEHQVHEAAELYGIEPGKPNEDFTERMHEGIN
jgi:ubiquinol-cytochrome c reductase cytochrome b subunit